MAVIPHTIDIVVKDLNLALAFYRTLGLNAPGDGSGEEQVQIATPGGATIGLVTEALMRQTNPAWMTPVGQRVTFSCRCDRPDEVDEVFARVKAAGFIGLKEPWDAFWGQRYAFLQDPDGNRVDLFAAISEGGQE